ncbi:hypothetical protein Q3G72_010715 [Acer saccharum]|nr:hypothetical protein Q3G72_010715 [Acer saccharum]
MSPRQPLTDWIAPPPGQLKLNTSVARRKDSCSQESGASPGIPKPESTAFHRLSLLAAATRPYEPGSRAALLDLGAARVVKVIGAITKLFIRRGE